MKAYFISDLHLQESRPEITASFEAFVDYCLEEKNRPDLLFILGDLFEVWLGDDAQSDFQLAITRQLLQLSMAGVELKLMHGNRDFLIGEDFCRQTGASLIDDPYLLKTPNGNMLLSHGDMLCTDDREYMQFRAMVRNPDTQREFLAKPIAERLTIAAGMREQSEIKGQQKSMEIMDVNQDAVKEMLLKHGVNCLIHGHTHRPAFHRFETEAAEMERIVLPSWEPQGKYLEYNDTQGLLQTFSDWSTRNAR